MKTGWVFDMTTLLKEWLIQNEYPIDDLNAVGKYGNSPLMKASREANIVIVDELLSLNADLNIKNVDGNSALWNACFGNSYECFEALVRAGIDIDSQNVNDVTALMYCASAGKEDFVELLLKHNARTDFESLDGFKAIDLAVTAKIVKLLKNANLS
ncbi:MAG: ankyrin repeat domain-containing protein [Arcobacteraceae bacterium]